MPDIDVLLQRTLRRIRDVLPGHTTASRLLRQSSAAWRHLPLHQRAAAYVQFYRTQQQLRQIHVEQKIVPKIINLLFAALCSHLGLQIVFFTALCAIVLALNP